MAKLTAIEHNKIFVTMYPIDSNSKKILSTLFVYYCVCYFLILITADFHIKIGRIYFFVPTIAEIIRCGVAR